jgi:hypothetical protein
MGPEAAHRLEDEGDAAEGGVFGQGPQAFGGADELAGRGAAALDDPGVPVKAAGIGPGAELGAEVDLAPVPVQAAGAVGRIVGGEVGVEGPMSRPISRARSRKRTSSSDQRRVKR